MSNMSNIDNLSNGPILYELLEYFVRKQEPELIKCKTDTAILPTPGTIKNALRYLNNRYSLPESISQQISLTLPWKFAIGDSARLLAVLQENVIEIRKAKDEYSSVVGKASVPKDAFPQWRKIVWSPDGTILALASSSGHISFYNFLGNNIFNITPKTMSQNPHILEAGDAIASMVFLKPKTDAEKWSYEFISITYSGLLKSYNISLNSGYIANYEFSFGNFYRNGVNAVSYDAQRDLFYVAGNTIMQKLMSSAAETGLTSWRRLNDYPYFKLSFTFDNNVKTTPTFFIWNIIPTLKFHAESIIFKMKLSPNGKHLVCLHTDGSVSLWALPNLVLQNKWKLNEQPDFNIPNPLRLMRCKKFPPGFTEFHPIDIGWWSEQAIIITRYSGSTSVCSIKDLKNLLGISPEFLAGQPQISELDQNCGFLCLDCEIFITSRKRSRDLSGEGQTSEISSESEREDDEVEPMTILNYTTNLVQSTLYSITDIERFQPKRKKSKILYRTYRLLALKSTTPEELYSRKIEIEEYEEALALANTYNLDTDLVYQTQWRKSKLSLNAIQEHLSKVTKRSWVLNECITRVPDSMEAARELLNFGLKGANLETLIAIGICDNGKFVSDDTDESNVDIDERTMCLRQAQKVNEMFEKIDIKNLSEAQKDLIRYRRQLLNHLDKLLTYEIILESPLKYNKEFYEEFRQLSAVENAIKFAKDCDCRAVEIMFTYYGEKLLPHWLAIMNFFPETLNPLNYEKLLPECDSDGQLFLLDQRELRQKDWSEKSEFNDVINCNDDDKSQALYDADPALYEYRNVSLTPELLQKWYKSRAYQIERNSFMIDNALQLIKIAKSHNIAGLEELLIDLETLDDVVYNVYVEDMYLDQLVKLSNLEKIKLLMSKCNEENFVKNIKNLLLPFIKRRHQYLGGEIPKQFLCDYLISLSAEDLTLPVKFFEYVKRSSDTEINDMLGDVASLAIECIYACNNPNSIDNVKSILDSIPKDYGGNRRSSSYLLEELEKELESVKIMSKYNVRVTLNFLRKNKNDPEEVKSLLIQMARSLNMLVPTPGEKQWAQLLNDMLEIHGLVFSCVDVEVCLEICVSTRLISGVKSNIQKCSTLIETKKAEGSLLKVSYEKAVSLILDASKEYFNSSKSLTDSNMELAKACLNLIEDDNAKIKEEYDLIKSLQILNEFNTDMLPFQIRQTNDRLKLIEHCLNKHEETYKSRQRLLTLANYLRIERKDSRTREGKVLELVAKKALEVEDYNVCATVCQQLMQSNYIPAWTIILKLGYCENFRDFKLRQRCLWFAINNGPNDILSEALERMHLIEIQSLHENLELWMPQEETDYLDTNETESDDEFTDAMTTPQVERKEFVPKVLEASTEIVRNSASAMKESTFGLIKNISVTNFWKSNLQLNFSNSTKEHSEVENNQTEDKTNLQSFPCFYESLHANCKISNFDIKYDKYSMPTIENTKLKCCQALLRITVLSESSCYGLEVSDINHLFLECAKHTISEDWPLGMAYLLSLNSGFTNEVKGIFADLPTNDLFIQTIAYYYSLRLYKKTFKDAEKVYLYEPISLIYKMLSLVETLDKSDLQVALLDLREYFLNKSENASFSQTENFNEYEKEECIGDNGSLDKSKCETVVEEREKKEAEGTGEIPAIESSDVPSISDSRDVEWTDEWGDFSDEENLGYTDSGANIPRTDSHSRNSHLLFKDVDKCNSEDDRFELFTKICKEVKIEEHYDQVKKILLQWPKFTKPEFITTNSHPVIKLLKAVPTYSKKNSADSLHDTYREYKNLAQHFDSVDALTEFLHSEQDDIPLEDILYIKLCTNDPELQAEVVESIKEKYQNLSLEPAVLEEIFLKNLTACFSPNHPIYKQIIEHVFVNESLTDIEDNARILVNKLIELKHTGQALSLIGLVENVPSFLRTFDNCYQLLMKK